MLKGTSNDQDDGQNIRFSFNDPLHILQGLNSDLKRSISDATLFLQHLDFSNQDDLQRIQYLFLALLEKSHNSDPRLKQGIHQIIDKFVDLIHKQVQIKLPELPQDQTEYMQRLMSQQIIGKPFNLMGATMHYDADAIFDRFKPFYNSTYQNDNCTGLGMIAVRKSSDVDCHWVDKLAQMSTQELTHTMMDGIPYSPMGVAILRGKFSVAKYLLEQGGDPAWKGALGVSAVLICDEEIYKEQKKPVEIRDNDKLQQLQNLLSLFQSKAMAEMPQEVNFGQGIIIQKVKDYVNWHNLQYPESPIKLNEESDAGWCAGFSAVWGELKANGNKNDNKENEIWFFRTLRDIANLNFDQWTPEQHRNFEKIIGFVNVLQTKEKTRENYGFDNRQWQLNEALGLDNVDRLQFVCSTKDELKQILQYHAERYPDVFIRLSCPGHSTAFVYDSKNKEFVYYDPNHKVGNADCTTSDSLDAAIFKTSEQRLGLDDFAEKLKIAFDQPYEQMAVETEVYKKIEAIQPSEKDENAKAKQALISKLLDERARQNQKLDVLSKDGESAAYLAAHKDDIDSFRIYAQRGFAVVNPKTLSAIILRNNREMFDLYCAAVPVQSGLTENLSSRVTEGMTALGFAVHLKRTDMIKALVERGVDINSPSFQNGKQLFGVLDLAHIMKDKELFNFLMQEGAEPSMRVGASSVLEKIVYNNDEEFLSNLFENHNHKIDSHILLNILSEEGARAAVSDKTLSLIESYRPGIRESLVLLTSIDTAMQNYDKVLNKKIPMKDPSNRDNYQKQKILQFCKDPQSVDLKAMLEITKSKTQRTFLSRLAQKSSNSSDLSVGSIAFQDLDVIKNYILDNKLSNVSNCKLLVGKIQELIEQRHYNDESKVGTLLQEMQSELLTVVRKGFNESPNIQACLSLYQQAERQKQQKPHRPPMSTPKIT